MLSQVISALTPQPSPALNGVANEGMSHVLTRWERHRPHQSEPAGAATAQAAVFISSGKKKKIINYVNFVEETCYKIDPMKMDATSICVIEQ